jgi:hypothetical protein
MNQQPQPIDLCSSFDSNVLSNDESKYEGGGEKKVARDIANSNSNSGSSISSSSSSSGLPGDNESHQKKIPLSGNKKASTNSCSGEGDSIISISSNSAEGDIDTKRTANNKINDMKVSHRKRKAPKRLVDAIMRKGPQLACEQQTEARVVTAKKHKRVYNYSQAYSEEDDDDDDDVEIISIKKKERITCCTHIKNATSKPSKNQSVSSFLAIAQQKMDSNKEERNFGLLNSKYKGEWWYKTNNRTNHTTTTTTSQGGLSVSTLNITYTSYFLLASTEYSFILPFVHTCIICRCLFLLCLLIPQLMIRVLHQT